MDWDPVDEKPDLFALAYVQKLLDEMVEEGIVRVDRIDKKGRKLYALTELGRSPYLHLDVPETKQ
jgi:predicted transcriptional regulator